MCSFSLALDNHSGAKWSLYLNSASQVLERTHIHMNTLLIAINYSEINWRLCIPSIPGYAIIIFNFIFTTLFFCSIFFFFVLVIFVKQIDSMLPLRIYVRGKIVPPHVPARGTIYYEEMKCSSKWHIEHVIHSRNAILMEYQCVCGGGKALASKRYGEMVKGKV